MRQTARTLPALGRRQSMPEKCAGASRRRAPLKASDYAQRVMDMAIKHGQARLLLVRGLPVASRMESRTKGRMLGVYNEHASLQAIEENISEAMGQG